MSCARNDHWLVAFLLALVLPNLLRCFEPIKDRHRQVHKDQSILEIVIIEGFLHFSDSFDSVSGRIDEIFDIHVSPRCLQNDLEANEVVRLIINHEDSLVIVALLKVKLGPVLSSIQSHRELAHSFQALRRET